MTNFTKQYLQESKNIIDNLSDIVIEDLVKQLVSIRDRGGRLFVLGMGGSAGTSSHFVNDARKICNIEAYTPTDNVSEFSARVNDEGVENTFSAYLKGSKLTASDGIFILSVGGGSAEKNISLNLVKAIYYAKSMQATVLGVVGRDGGYTYKTATTCLVIPPLYADRTTAHTEGLASLVLHLIVSHPDLKLEQTKWESTK